MDLSIDEVLTRGVTQVLPSKDNLKKLMQERKITLYQGFDPSMPSLHLGNLVGIMKLRQFQKLGHKVIFLIGDFTGMTGDPDKKTTRIQLTREETLKNSEKWKDQISKILDLSGDNPIEIKFNSEWNDKINYKELIDITSKFTVQQILERDLFQNRLKANIPIHLHEFLYPVTQAIDSIKMVPGGVDLEIGGNDQLFNILAGRELMKATHNKEKYILTTKLLVDKNGDKVGKTTGNALFLDSNPSDFFGGIMSFPDEVILTGFELLTEIELAGLEEKIKSDPMREKKYLAREIVKLIWGESGATIAENNFTKTFQERKPDYKQIVTSGESLSDTIAPYTAMKSVSDAKRYINQNSVDVNGITIKDPTYKVKTGDKIKVGEKVFLEGK
jgi:tyrosyl-tRNA synthetase